VPTQLELQKMKKEIVGSFSSSLKPSYTIQHLWYTARCFKNCVIPSLRPDNDVWFESFCSKIAPYYVSNKSEIFPCYTPSDCLHYVLTNNFNLLELQLAISSRKSIVSGPNNISPLMFKHLSQNALDSLLSIINNISNNQQIPSSWNSY